MKLMYRSLWSASAVAVILFLMTFVLGRVFMKVFSSKDQ